MLKSMTTREFQDRLDQFDEATNGPMGKALLGVLFSVLIALSAWTLQSVQTSLVLGEKLATHQIDMDKKIEEVHDDVREAQLQLQAAEQAALVLKQRFDDYVPFPKSRDMPDPNAQPQTLDGPTRPSYRR